MKKKVIKVKVGTPGTIYMYSDRHAVTVTKVTLGKSGKRKGLPVAIEVTRNEVKCKDYFAGDWEVLPTLTKITQTFTLRKNGEWVALGEDYGRGTLLALGYQHEFEDPSY